MKRDQCCGSGSGIRDPIPLNPGSGMGKKLGSGMNNPDHISDSLETVFRLKYLNSLMRIRDPGWKKFGSGRKTSQIRNTERDLAKSLPVQRKKVTAMEGTVHIY